MWWRPAAALGRWHGPWGVVGIGCSWVGVGSRHPQASRRCVWPSPRSKRQGSDPPSGRGACTFDACWSAVSRSGHSWPRSSRQARHGSAGSVVLRGEPGVGKSALLDELVCSAGEATVLRTQGLEVEAPLGVRGSAPAAAAA